MTWTLDIDEDRLSVKDAEQLRQQLVARQTDSGKPPVIALLTAPDGACLGIGLGHSLSTLTYIAPSGWPSRHSVGEDNDGMFEYQIQGQLSELPARYMISLEMALSVATEFICNRELGLNVEWQDD